MELWIINDLLFKYYVQYEILCIYLYVYICDIN